MIDIDLGPVFLYLFILLFIIPALIGFFIGIGASYLLIRKKAISKIKRVAIMVFAGILLAILFPGAAIKFSRWQNDYENKKFNLKEKQYIEQNLNNFRIEKVSFNNDVYQILLSVPRNGKYRVTVYHFQNNKQRTLLLKSVDGIDLVEGVNTLNIDIQDKKITPLPADLAITIQNTNDSYALRNTIKSVFVTNAGEVEKQEGVIYYSPYLVENNNGECPIFNYLNWLPCIPNSLLHLE